MFRKSSYLSVFVSCLILLFFFSCSPKISNKIVHNKTKNVIIDSLPNTIISDTVKKVNLVEKHIIEPGDKQFHEYLPLLAGKNVALVANQTSVIDSVHLLDFLLSRNINVVKIFALEHGFRGTVDRGENFSAETDKKTGIPIIAVYGKNRKPKGEQLADIDIVIFDIQDVGVRFYTYISSMYLLMEACAENHKKFMILDRPNPLGFYVDGPVLKPQFKSFVGMLPIPVVHGLTLGEAALMINGEHWLKNGLQCDLTIIKAKNYKHSDFWYLPIKPSPNLPNDQAILLYPSLCFFEATEISIGRGTKFPFQVIAYPDVSFGTFSFIPKDIPGMQMNPVQEGKTCYGIDLRKTENVRFSLKYLIDFYAEFPDKSKFITRKRWFNLLAGNSELYNQIMSGMSEEAIRKTWRENLNSYKEIRKKYLLYVDFE
ncbi:MAG: DUF1343 domain-containing protein [Bacteroidales bacterium]|nr:DUF1343 domain-containing protein [Bacteroidales bacterium]